MNIHDTKIDRKVIEKIPKLRRHLPFLRNRI